MTQLCKGDKKGPWAPITSWGQHGPTWVLLAPDGPHVGPMNLAIKVIAYCTTEALTFVHCTKPITQQPEALHVPQP